MWIICLADDSYDTKRKIKMSTAADVISTLRVKFEVRMFKKGQLEAFLSTFSITNYCIIWPPSQMIVSILF